LGSIYYNVFINIQTTNEGSVEDLPKKRVNRPRLTRFCIEEARQPLVDALFRSKRLLHDRHCHRRRLHLRHRLGRHRRHRDRHCHRRHRRHRRRFHSVIFILVVFIFVVIVLVVIAVNEIVVVTIFNRNSFGSMLSVASDTPIKPAVAGEPFVKGHCITTGWALRQWSQQQPAVAGKAGAGNP